MAHLPGDLTSSQSIQNFSSAPVQDTSGDTNSEATQGTTQGGGISAKALLERTASLTLFTVNSAFRLLPTTDEQSSIFGRLPNSPAPDTALAEKTEELSQRWTEKDASNSTNMRAVTGALDSLLQTVDGHVTQGGEHKTLTQGQFHTALQLGAHFVAEDGGALYAQLVEVAGDEKTARGSSHYPDSDTQQYGFDTAQGHLLIGKDTSGNSWFQFEAHGFGGGKESLMEKVGHTQDYFNHVSHSDFVQMGPGGCIAASEKDGKEYRAQPEG